ncbi:precorrin-2 C(20)-methyltransferase [Ferroacidibacillus organovorans]|uniref:Precorrin-2 C(20)-methyltransferase n=1 Tax=Ferroacidibacillus organovorans TaxID=1765683 RepID=A0A853KBU9_9BACL|nr:precorrin-2 C(20)-methyltransferase [Ferroacidibacillus organovorans]KYP79462.1 precorrin-2 C(20)-methyltransferase [Ferroacidibacillus organovorans]OAG94516.1 precorrin-2 C(20)-methyltransferase [Ferroacidibacillus organovorans]
MSVNHGTLYGVGVGPGDPELVTVKAYRLMQTAPVIAYPNKRMGGKSYALEIVERYVNPSEKTMLGLVFPMTKDEDVLLRHWEDTVEKVWAYLRQGQDVVFVTEGDPMLYSTFIHMSRLMRQEHPEAEVVSIPGVSSVNAAASRLGVPLADGDEVVAIVPANRDLTRMRQALLTHDCVVFLKVAKVMDDMILLLGELQLIDNAMVCTKVTSAGEHVWKNVRELQGASLNYLTLMVVRK